MSDGSIGTALDSDRRRFHVKSCLGRGGFGEVYRATMVGAGGVRIEVAIKVLHAEVDPHSQAVQRLKDEARMLGAVQHPSVLAVHGLTLLDGRVALIMEFVEGADLDKCVGGEHPITVKALLETTARVAEALNAGWEAPSPDGSGPIHLVHRDIKPANIRLGVHGEVKVLDFGIAHANNVQREARTETNAMLGSYLYMAPERFLEAGESGPEVDVFALGCTLYESLARKRLFGQMTLKEMYVLVLEPPKYDAYVRSQLLALPKDLPHQVVALIRRMVALNPRERPTHASLAHVCRELADRLPGLSLDRWARQRPWPRPGQVRGMLDGAVITETGFSASKLHRLAQTTRRDEPADLTASAELQRSPLGITARTGRPPGFAPSDPPRLLTQAFERPGVAAVGMGVGVLGLFAAGIGGLLVVAVVAGGGWWWWSRPEVGSRVTVPLPVAAPAPVVELPAPAEPVVEAQPAPVPVSAPAPIPVPAPVAAPSPEPIVVIVAPPPAPVDPAPPPAPVDPAPPAPEPAATPAGRAMVRVTGTTALIEFKGPAGVTRSRSLEPGQYEVVAWFDGVPRVQPDTLTSLNAGQSYTLSCSQLLQQCKWVK